MTKSTTVLYNTLMKHVGPLFICITLFKEFVTVVINLTLKAV